MRGQGVHDSRASTRRSASAGAGSPAAANSDGPCLVMRSASVVRLILSSAAARDLFPFEARSAHAINCASTSRSRSSSETDSGSAISSPCAGTEAASG